jgi:hypothetical protein
MEDPGENPENLENVEINVNDNVNNNDTINTVDRSIGRLVPDHDDNDNGKDNVGEDNVEENYEDEDAEEDVGDNNVNDENNNVGKNYDNVNDENNNVDVGCNEDNKSVRNPGDTYIHHGRRCRVRGNGHLNPLCRGKNDTCSNIFAGSNRVRCKTCMNSGEDDSFKNRKDGDLFIVNNMRYTQHEGRHARLCTSLNNACLNFQEGNDGLCVIHSPGYQPVVKTKAKVIKKKPTLRTTETFKTDGFNRHKGYYSYDNSLYTRAKSNITVTCPKHGDFQIIAANHLQGQGCRTCGNGMLTKEEFYNECDIIHNHRYIYDEDRNDKTILKSTEFITVECRTHGKFQVRAYAHKAGTNCQSCAYEENNLNKILDQTDVVLRMTEEHKGRYDYSQFVYVNAITPGKIICKKHGGFMQCSHTHLKGSGCPRCRESKGEQKVAEYLRLKGLEFETQKRYPNCKFINTLPFDFYVPKYDLLIEFDGKQHFESRSHDKDQNYLRLCQLRDNIKNQFAFDYFISLVRIKYNEDITAILDVNIQSLDALDIIWRTTYGNATVTVDDESDGLNDENDEFDELNDESDAVK